MNLVTKDTQLAYKATSATGPTPWKPSREDSLRDKLFDNPEDVGGETSCIQKDVCVPAGQV